MFLAYVPFELIFPWHGTWDSLPAAHAAAITFDLLTVAGLLLLGRRLREGREGRTLGIALAYAWAAFPYSAYVLQSNTNDGLVAMLLVYSLLALRTPALRGALLGLATAAKFFPVALAPLLAAGTGDRRARPLVRFGLAFAAVCWSRSTSPCRPAARASSGTRRSATSSRESRRSACGVCTRRSGGSRHPPGRRRRLLRRARVRPAPARRAPGRGARGCGRDRAPALCELLAVLLCHVVRAARAGGDAGGLPAVARRARARSPCLG